MLTEHEDRNIWKIQGLGERPYYEIGKFRSDPCESGNYSWLQYPSTEIFEYVYSEINEDGVKGLIIFSKK